MNASPTPGLFITGTDTGIGKTYVGALIAETLCRAGHRVGVYKPVESGCRHQGGDTIADDATRLWQAAGRPGTLEAVCPQRFATPLAPHLAARAERRALDARLLRQGLQFWRENSDVVLVEGVGGLMSPVTPDTYVADLAEEFGYPLIVVTADRLGAINQTLQTLITAATFREGLEVAGVVLNRLDEGTDDVSAATNAAELRERCVPPVLAHVGPGATEIDPSVDWLALASSRRRS